MREIIVAAGDCVMTTANDRRNGIVNGEALTVRTVALDGTMICANKHGVEKTLPPEWRHLRYGYAVTSHKAQGRTVDRVVVAARQLDGSAAYVATSRGRESCRIHTPSKEELIGLAGSSERPLAMEAFDRGALREGMRNEALKSERRRAAAARERKVRENRGRIREIEEWANISRETVKRSPLPSDVTLENMELYQKYPDIPREKLDAFQAHSDEYGIPVDDMVEEQRAIDLGVVGEPEIGMDI